MEDRIKEQLIDSGAVIGYRPDLKYKKETNNTNTITSNNSNGTKTSIIYPETVKSIMNNMPSTMLSSLNDALEDVNDAIGRLSEEFENAKYDEYNSIENFINAINNNKKYTNDFLNYHKENISKSSIPETIYILIKEKERVKMLEETLKKLYYGDSDISLEEAKQKDLELKEIIVEKAKEDKGLNYISLSYDAKLNRAISIFGSNLDTAVLEVEQAALVSESTNATVNTNLTIIAEKLFDDADSKMNDRTNAYNSQQNLDTMQKTLYNYYSKRDELNKYYQIVSTYSSEGSYLLSQLERFEKQAEASLENVNKSMLGNVYYLNSIEELITEKQYLRSLYATLSYN